MKKSFSWGLIILMLIVFFPVGIFMIVKKMQVEKFNYINNGKSLKILGYVLVGMAVIYLVDTLTTGQSDALAVAIILFGGGGALAIYKGSMYEKRGNLFNRYFSIIGASQDLIIDNIAAAVPTTYEKAVSDIQVMIDAGFLGGSYIDNNRHELVMPKAQSNSNDSNDNMNNTPNTDPNLQPHSVKCANCGATSNFVPGKQNVCEYCGSPLE